MAIALRVEVSKETVAQIMLPTDSIDRVYRRRLPGGIAMIASTVIAVNWKTQLLRRDLIIGQPAVFGQLGDYSDGNFSPRVEGTYCGGSVVAVRVLG